MKQVRCECLFWGFPIYYIASISLLFSLSFSLGCTSRIWTHYPGQLSRTKSLLAEGKDRLAAKGLSSMLRSAKDRLLHSMELGMVYYLEGDFEGCIQEWLAAEKIIEEFDRRPIISLRHISEMLGTLPVNDYLITYQGMTYERALVHVFLSLAYIMTSNPEEARVELKKAEEVQKSALARLQEQRGAFFRDSPQARHIERDLLNVYDYRYSMPDNYKSNGLNPFVYYLSGWLYDAQGYPDEALIDYKRVWDLGIRAEFLAQDIEHLSQLMQIQKTPSRIGSMEKSGDLLILYHCGLVPHLRELSLPIEIQDSILMLAIPVYLESSPPNTRLLARSGEFEVETSEIVNIYSLAKESLRERAPGIAIRQVARMAFKSMLANEISKKAGSLARVVSSLYNIIGEKADLRSWLTVPFTIQVGRMRLPPGQHLIDFYSEGAGIHKQVEVQIKAGEYKIVDVHSIGSRIIVHGP